MPLKSADLEFNDQEPLGPAPRALELVAVGPHLNRINEIGLVDGHGGVNGLAIEIAAEFVGAANI